MATGNLMLLKPNTDVLKMFYVYRWIKTIQWPTTVPHGIKLINNCTIF